MIHLKDNRFLSMLSLALAASLGCGSIAAQNAAKSGSLPDAPGAPVFTAQLSIEAPQHNSVQYGDNSRPQPAQPSLTRLEAEEMAIKNNPRISIAHLLALAQHQVVREMRSAELPTAAAALTAEEAEDGSRVSAGSLAASRLFTHAGAGGGFAQLITDFGRTGNLVASSKLQESAQNANALATAEEIVLATDQAFFTALESQAMLKVAQQNTSTRQATDSQVKAYTQNKLKSTLDLSFADVNLSQAKLLELDAQSNTDSSMAALDAVLGLDHEVTYNLVGEDGALPPLSTDSGQLIRLALKQRPDLQALTLNRQAEVKFSHAERDQMLPSITAQGTAGAVPVRPGAFYTTSWWGGIGANVSIPVFNGFLYSAQAREASLRAQADSEEVRDLHDRIVRDVRTAWLAADAAYRRIAVSGELLKQANLSLGLAQTRYQLGLSSIVELSQAQYQQTDAAIGNTNAQYQYRLALATLNYQTGVAP